MNIPKIIVTDAVWSPKTLFNYKGKEKPFIGVSVDKLQQADSVDITLGFFKKMPPTYAGVNTKAFLNISRANNWQNSRRGRDIVYLPIKELENISSKLDMPVAELNKSNKGIKE